MQQGLLQGQQTHSGQPQAPALSQEQLQPPPQQVNLNVLLLCLNSSTQQLNTLVACALSCQNQESLQMHQNFFVMIIQVCRSRNSKLC